MRQTRVAPPVPVPAPPPPLEHWPDTSVACYCRDAAHMTLEEFDWCLRKNHWNADLEHVPAGWPSPPLQEPVWWWPGWGTKWGKLPQPVDRNRYVECWYIRGKSRAREEFKPYFGTLESETAAEFSKQSLGSGSLAEAIRREEASLMQGSLEDNSLVGGVEPLFIPPASISADMFRESLSDASAASRSRRK